jgi:hypothetical protein
MLHRYHKAMVRPGRERLRGHVEVDETYVGGDEQGVTGRQTETKANRRDRRRDRAPKGLRTRAYAAHF